MNNVVKTKFSIKDLESLSGIKAHTIRIWEKRYKLLEPSRTPTNIRYYTLEDLQKLLNVTFLNQNGYKISKIAKNNSKEIASLVSIIVRDQEFGDYHHAANSFKIAMMNFDQHLFYETYDTLLESTDFRTIFYNCFMPLLHEIGLLWQTDTINPAHEHFLYNLIKQKVMLNIEDVQHKVRTINDETFVLFLPENEIHELGLIFLNYEIVSLGYKCIYLGQSIALESLQYISINHPNITFASYFTVQPEVEDLPDYFKEFENLFGKKGHTLYVLGARTRDIDELDLPDSIRPVLSIREFINSIKNTKRIYA